MEKCNFHCKAASLPFSLPLHPRSLLPIPPFLSPSSPPPIFPSLPPSPFFLIISVPPSFLPFLLLPPGVKLLVVGTLTVEDGVSLEGPEFLGLPDLFLQHHHIPLLDHSATLTFLNARNIHKYD